MRRPDHGGCQKLCNGYLLSTCSMPEGPFKITARRRGYVPQRPSASAWCRHLEMANLVAAGTTMRRRGRIWLRSHPWSRRSQGIHLRQVDHPAEVQADHAADIICARHQDRRHGRAYDDGPAWRQEDTEIGQWVVGSAMEAIHQEPSRSAEPTPLSTGRTRHAESQWRMAQCPDSGHVD